MALSGLKDLATLDAVSALVGDATTTRTSTTHARDGSRTRTDAPTREPLLSRDRLRGLERGQAVLLYGNLPPARLRLRRPVRPVVRRPPAPTSEADDPDPRTAAVGAVAAAAACDVPAGVLAIADEMGFEIRGHEREPDGAVGVLVAGGPSIGGTELARR